MYKKPIIILGTGGHAKVVADALEKLEKDILGFVSPDLKKGSDFLGYEVLGDDNVINHYSPKSFLLANGVGALPQKELRWDLAAQMRQMGYSFTSVIHPASIIASNVGIAEGVQLMAGVIIQSGVEIAEDSIINTGASIDHDCDIARNCHIAPGVVCSGGVSIGESTHIGTSSSIIQNIVIGQRCVIAAGSTIHRNVPDGTTVIQSK